MAIIKSQLAEHLSGKLGNFIVYEVKGQLRVRTRPSKYKDRKSPSQLASRAGVRGIARLYRQLEPTLRVYWKTAAEDLSLNGYNLFMSRNKHCLSHDGTLSDFAAFKICDGKLPLPSSFQSEMTTERIVCMEWSCETSNWMAHEDFLQIAAVSPVEGLEKRIRVIASTKIRRKDGRCEWQLPAGETSPLHLYAFFHSSYTGDVSPSVYLGFTTQESRASK